VLYDHAYTLQRWSKSRGPEIVGMPSGEWVGYTFHQSVIPYMKTQGAENIQLSELQEIDKYGEPIQD